MPLADEGAVEGQHLANQSADLVAVVEDAGVDAGVDTEELKAQIGDALEGERPLGAQRLLAAHHPSATRQRAGRDGGGEHDVVVEVVQHASRSCALKAASHVRLNPSGSGVLIDRSSHPFTAGVPGRGLTARRPMVMRNGRHLVFGSSVQRARAPTPRRRCACCFADTTSS